MVMTPSFFSSSVLKIGGNPGGCRSAVSTTSDLVPWMCTASSCNPFSRTAAVVGRLFAGHRARKVSGFVARSPAHISTTKNALLFLVTAEATVVSRSRKAGRSSGVPELRT